tara:strand:+ start:1108 stop:1296 length:189 start_codon:yes stop_codon:yes gene_type:complete
MYIKKLRDMRKLDNWFGGNPIEQIDEIINEMSAYADKAGKVVNCGVCKNTKFQNGHICNVCK